MARRSARLNPKDIEVNDNSDDNAEEYITPQHRSNIPNGGQNTPQNNSSIPNEGPNVPQNNFNIPNGYRLVRDQEDGQFNSIMSIKPNLQYFKGFNDKVTIDNWLKRFEILSDYYKWSERDQVFMIGNFLQDDAFNFYVENYTSNWSELKSKLINRFGHETVDPIIELINLKYDIKKGIKDYFDNTRRLGTLAKLSEEQIVPIMINGLHPRMIAQLAANKPKTFNKFYEVAKTLEDNYKQLISQTRNFKQNTTQSKTDAKTKSKTIVKPKTKPPNACKICEKLGFPNRMHWMNDCKNKTQTQTTAKQVNINEQSADDTDSVEFPQLSQINLN